MVQVIEQADLGAKIGRGFGSGLDLLVASKMQSMQEQQKMELASQLKRQELQEKMAVLQSILGGADVPGTDVEVDMLDAAREPRGRSGEISNEQILAVSAIDPNMAKLLQAQKDTGSRDTASKFKETKEVRSNIVKQAQAAHENNMRLNRMKKLNDTGKLIGGLFNSTLKKFGLDLPALKNPESQEFEKLSTDMLRNAKEIFGARVTNFEMDTFLKSIPTLSQTKEGRERVIRNLKIFNEGAAKRLDAMKKIIKANGGTPPYDLGEQIEEMIGGDLDEMMREFVAGAPAGGGMAQLPDPGTIQQGRIIIDRATGKRYRNTGVEWEEISS